MAYRFELNECFTDGFRRIAMEQIEHIELNLNAPEVGAEQIYETRKTIKRLRSLLRLVRHGLNVDEFTTYNNLLRNMSQRLGVFRDLDSMRETLQNLKPNVDARHMLYIEQLYDILSSRKNALMKETGTMAIERTLLDKSNLASALHATKFSSLDPDVLGAGLIASYKAGSMRLQIAIHTDHSESFHECRKSVQQHWRHMQLLQNGRPAEFKRRADTAKELAQLLGKDHDLCLVRFFTQKQIGNITAQGAGTINTYCAGLQKNLRCDAVSVGQKLFQDHPAALAQKVINHWRAAAQTSDMKS